MLLIERPRYLERLIRLVGTPDIKVITCVRRAGKSKLLEAFRDYPLRKLHGANVIHVDLSLLEFARHGGTWSPMAREPSRRKGRKPRRIFGETAATRPLQLQPSAALPLSACTRPQVPR